MARKRSPIASDVRGLGQLTIDAIVGIVDVVEAMHYNIGSLPGIRRRAKHGRTTGITGFVYRTINGTVRLVGHALDALLAKLRPLLRAGSDWPGREAVLAVLNGVLGDYLAASNNPLAITMALHHNGHTLPVEAAALAVAIPNANDRVVVLVHGLCMNDLQWNRQEHDHGAALARDLGLTPIYLYYNTGLHISVNGRAFADRLEALVQAWPVPLRELAILGHSMGGLVARSACHYGALAGQRWVSHLDKLIFLGTPHQGAPLERGGNWVDLLLGGSPYTAPLARLGKIRSAGITDLRYGNMIDEDWKGRDRFERSGDVRQAVPFPEGAACFNIAATTGKKAGDLSDRLFGDGIVPLASALGRHREPRLALTFPESRQWIAYGMNHLDLLGRHEVYAKIRTWVEAPG